MKITFYVCDVEKLEFSLWTLFTSDSVVRGSRETLKTSMFCLLLIESLESHFRDARGLILTSLFDFIAICSVKNFCTVVCYELLTH